MTNATRQFGAFGLMLTVLAIPAGAQPASDAGLPVATFAEIALRANVTPGATLVVTDSSGQRVKGKLTALSANSLSILTGRGPRTFSDQQVREVRQRLSDTKREGALIGLAAGWLVPAAVCTGRSDSSETLGCVLGTLILGGLPGLAIGAAIDAAQRKTVTIFRSRR